MTSPRHRTLATALLVLAAVAATLTLSAIARADQGGGPRPTGPPTTSRPAPIVYRPAGLSMARKVPLLVALYGTQGCPQCMEGLTHFEAVARQNGFVVAYPGSQVFDGSPWGSVSDIPYISSLISSVEQSQNIDPSRVYVAGFSAGGRFAYQVGCALSSQITAIAEVGSIQHRYSCPLSHPLSELNIEGSTERINGVPGRGIPSATQLEGIWRQRDGCTGRIVSSSSGPAVEQFTTGCADGSRVGLVIIQRGIHTWPGCSCKFPAGSPDAQWDASQAIWSFFSGLRSGSPTRPDAGVGAVRFSASKRGRTITTTYHLGEAVSVTEVLVAHGRTVARRTFTLHTGAPRAQLRLPNGLKKGHATLRIAVIDQYGRALHVSRNVNVTS